IAPCSRATIAAATSAGGALRYWLQTFCVSSWAGRDCQSGATVAQLFSMTLSTTAGSTAAFFCCAVAAPANSSIRPARMIACLCMAFIPLSLDGGRGDLPALGLVGEIAGKRDGGVRAIVDQRQAHLPVAVGDAVLHGHHGALRDAVGGPFADHLARLF